MKREPNIKRDTVGNLTKEGCDFFIPIDVVKEIDTTTNKVFIKVSPIQLSKAVFKANRSDELIVDIQFGRNGSKTAFVIPCF
jgi:hypothetical protein